MNDAAFHANCVIIRFEVNINNYACNNKPTA